MKSGHISCPRQFSFEAYLRERLGLIVVCVVEVDRNIWLMTLDGDVITRRQRVNVAREPVGMACIYINIYIYVYIDFRFKRNLERGSRSNL